MSDDSRDGWAPHARREAKIRRLRSSDARALHAYLDAKDVRPRPREADLTSFLGRNDAATFAAHSPEGITATASGILDRGVLHLQWVAFDGSEHGQNGYGAAGQLVGELESFARQAGAAMLYAQVREDDELEGLLRSCGFAEDASEREVVLGRPRVIVDLVKILA